MTYTEEKKCTTDIKKELSTESWEVILGELVNAMCEDEILPSYRVKLKNAYNELSLLRKEVCYG